MARSATSPLIGVVAGAVIGALGVAALVAADWPPTAEGPPPETAAAARRFVDAWRRSRESTWVLDGRFERVTTAGKRLATDVHIAQRPPDRVVTGLGTIDARVGDSRLACAPDDAGQVHCRRAGVARPYAEDVADVVRNLRSYVLGPGRFYAVSEDGRWCFRVRLIRRVLSPPYGEHARFCFDPATGAPVLSEIARTEGRDRTVAIRVKAAPTAADLDPEKGDGGGRG